jgi:hypothetical protein
MAAMDERNPHMKMFVADMLMDGHDTLGGILDLLNDRSIISWRDTVTRDFTWVDVVSAVEELLRDGLVDIWRDDHGLVEVENHSEAVLRSAEEGSERLWVRLTPEGRRAVEEWEKPTTMDAVLVQHLNALVPTSVSLHAAYRLLSEFMEQRLPSTEFADLIGSMLERGDLRLGQAQADGHLEPIPRLPADIGDALATFEPAEEQADPLGYYLTLGDLPPPAAPEPERESLIDIAHPKVLLEKLIKQDPDRQRWFIERKAVRHIVIGEGDSVTIGIGLVSEFRAGTRWSRGLPESEQGNIRHIVLNEEGEVVGDYFGPASLDPLDGR